MTQTSTTDEAYGAGGSLLWRNTGGDFNTRAFVPFNGRILAEYYWGSAPGTLFDHPDEIGSVSASTSYNGSSCQDLLYYPSGEPWTGTGSCGMHQEFAQLPDYDPETDQYNTLNRHYTPSGRWMSPDPGGMKVVKFDDPQTWNMYAYVRNNPTTLTDPTGLEVDLTGTDEEKKEEQRRIVANASRTDKNGLKESSLFKTVTDKNGKTTLVLDKDAAAEFVGKHSTGYNLLGRAITAKPVATVQLWDFDSKATLYANGNSTVRLDRNVAGIDLPGGAPLIDPANPGKDQTPLSIIAAHELLGHALGNMLHDPSARYDGPGSGAFEIENILRKEQNLIPRPDDMP